MKIRRRWRFSRPVLLGLAVVAALFAVAAAVQSYHDTQHYVGVDLANRITGARVLMAGHNPYKERPVLDASGVSLKPMQFVPGWVENPYPPTLSSVYGVFSSLRYPTLRVIWFGIEWGSLIASLLLLVRSLQRTNERQLLLSVGLLCFACSYFWRLHVERGQYYVLILLSLTAGAVTYLRHPGKPLAACIWFGIAAACRPTIMAIVLPFWIFGHRRLAIGTLGIAALLVGLTLPFVGLSTWRDYSAVVGHLERFIVNPEHFNQVHIDRIGSSTVEGYAQTELLPGRTLNLNLIGTVFPLLKSLTGRPVEGQWIILNKCIAVAYVILIALLLRRIARYRVAPRLAMAYAALFVIGLDFFVPMRFAYAEVVYLLPLGLAFPILLRGSPRWMLLVIAIGLLLGIDRLPISDIWSSIARPVLVFGGVAIALVWYGLRRAHRPLHHRETGTIQ